MGNEATPTMNPRSTVSRSGEAGVSQLVERFAQAWERGEAPTVESFLASHVPQGADASLAVRLVYEEICLRREAGCETPSLEVLQRFPQWRSELEMLFDCDRLLTPESAAAFPEAGEEIGPFRLLKELGRGAVGRVYLATQPGLSDRPVVVKCTPHAGQEHLSLARLQHTGIMPLYFAQSFPERSVRLLCMPYLGGATLATLLEKLADRPIAQRSGRDLAVLIEDASPVETTSHRGPAVQFLRRAAYTQAVCWIGACLADALHYAHQRGLNHFDVKPSNVLLAGDGQPMLLDFHLARGPVEAHASHETWLGGTPGYMSPEQQAAMSAMSSGRPVPATVDHRSDVYSLGVVLRELATGQSPAPTGSVVPTGFLDGRERPSCPPLESIIRRCLAPSPDDRYRDAGILASELRRAVAGAPAHGTLPRREWRKSTFSAVALTAALATAAAWTATASLESRATNEKLATAQELLNERLASDRAEHTAAHLEAVVDRLRWLSYAGTFDADAGRSLDAACSAVWANRRQMLDEADDPRLREHLLDLAILWADLRVRYAPPEAKPSARGQAVELLDAAQREFGPHPLVELELRRHRTTDDAVSDDIDGPGAPAFPPATTAWEHYALARALIQKEQWRAACAALLEGVAADPQDFWLQFTLGLAAQRLDRPEEALAAFSACVAISPDCVECYRRRAAVYESLGRDDLARRDREQAQRR